MLRLLVMRSPVQDRWSRSTACGPSPPRHPVGRFTVLPMGPHPPQLVARAPQHDLVRRALGLLCYLGLLGILNRWIRSVHSREGGDPPCDAIGVTSDSVDLFRRNRVKELETDEVEARLRIDDPSFVDRLLWSQHREVDPGEPWVESGAPDHVCDLHNPAAREALRGFIDKIIIPPGDGLLQVVGNLGAMLATAAGQKMPGRQAVGYVGCGGGDLNPRPLGYEPNELPDCSTPRHLEEQ